MASPTHLLHFLLLLLPATASLACHKDDLKALLAVKSSWGNPLVLSSWDPATPCCYWRNLTCDPVTGRVVDLSISHDIGHLYTTIPPAIGDLRALTSLTLTELHHHLAGPIPISLSRLTHLTSLRLASNALSGPVPSFLAALRSLRTIDLSSNSLTGSIPPELASLPELSMLDLSANRLTGPVPGSLGALRTDSVLYLQNNSLTGPIPRALGRVDFGELDVSWNRLSGDASFLFRRSNTTFPRLIDVSRNELEFDLGEVAEFQMKLRFLFINNNRIYGRIPRQITRVMELQYLDMSHNRLCGEIPRGGPMGRFGRSAFEHNRCLCGKPLPPCA